ncbi:tetratricopeptide repeat protein [Nocardia camponoti]|nr:hypothetical protein [Nocardia camponoti]
MSAAERSAAALTAHAAFEAWWAGDINSAEKLAAEAVRADPNELLAWQASARFAAAGLRRVEGDNVVRADLYAKRALRAAEKCVELGPNDAESYRLLAAALTGRDNKTAKEALEWATWRDPNNADNYVVRAHLVLAAEAPGPAAFDVADQLLRQALAINPYNREAQRALGVNAIRRGSVHEGAYHLATAAAGNRAAEAALPDTVRRLQRRFRPSRRVYVIAGVAVLILWRAIDFALSAAGG